MAQVLMDAVLQAVRQRIQQLGLSAGAAAAQIGVTPTSLERHLAGAYVRSDSLAKYRAWLGGRKAPRTAATSLFSGLEPGAPEAYPAPEDELARLILWGGRAPARAPYLVVDLFSGCGGMSLGLDLLTADDFPEPLSPAKAAPATNRGAPAPDRRPIFQTVLALEIESRVVGLHNDNHPPTRGFRGGPSRRQDVAEFLNAEEVLAFYLDHLADRGADAALRKGLDALPVIGLADFRAAVARLDACFLAGLRRLRDGAPFRQEYGRLEATVLGQTSVIGFHNALGLPLTSTAAPSLGPLPWADHDRGDAAAPGPPDLPVLKGFEAARRLAGRSLEAPWEAEVAKLRDRARGRGKGQLASSAGRIEAFLRFVGTEPMGAVRALWLEWRAGRDALRQTAFGAAEVFRRELKALYTEERRVAVLLGGPPCQGFSRIGRGKIRSLREHGVHVESDPEAGDARNRLLHKYVLFVSALEPRVFLFENVRHFQAEVKTPEGTFRATEILHDAIRELSQDRLDYRVGARVLDCSRHLVPQTRERYVMVGVRSDTVSVLPADRKRKCIGPPGTVVIGNWSAFSRVGTQARDGDYRRTPRQRARLARPNTAIRRAPSARSTHPTNPRREREHGRTKMDP